MYNLLFKLIALEENRDCVQFSWHQITGHRQKQKCMEQKQKVSLRSCCKKTIFYIVFFRH